MIHIQTQICFLFIFIYVKKICGLRAFLSLNLIKICIIEVYLLMQYFENHLIYKWRYYRQTILNQLNIMVPYVEIIGLCHSITILGEIYVMWHNFHFKRMQITGLCQQSLNLIQDIIDFVLKKRRKKFILIQNLPILTSSDLSTPLTLISSFLY